MGMKDLDQAARKRGANSPVAIDKTCESSTRGNTRRRTVGPKFEETHVRYTSYYRMDVFKRIEELRDQGKITNVKEFINDAIQKYIDLFY